MSDLVQRVPPVVRARALVKRFRSLVALDGVDLEAEAGECVGVLGPSGSGKSVLVRALYGRVLPDSGSVRIFGLDVVRQPRRVRAGLGVVPQDDDLDPSGTVRGELRLHGRCFGLPASESRTRIEEILAFVGIEDRRGRPIADLSPGTRRRAALARALLHAPSLLLADEPSMGLPPSERRALQDRLRALHRAGHTILLATRDPEEAALLCDRVVVLDHGRVLESGAPAALVERHAADRTGGLRDVFLRLAGRNLED